MISEFSCLRDESSFENRKVRFLKRPQILIADIWACFEGQGFGSFVDINEITMFAGRFHAAAAEVSSHRDAEMLHRLSHTSDAP